MFRIAWARVAVNLYGLWALAAIGLYAAHITLRALGPHDDPKVVVLSAGRHHLALTVTAFQKGHLPAIPGSHLWLPLLEGVLATTGQLWMTQACARIGCLFRRVPHESSVGNPDRHRTI